VQAFLCNVMKNSILLFVFLSISLLGLAQNGTEPKPVIEFEAVEHDFGKIYDGKPVSHEFKFTNKGKAPLLLSNVQPACGCTTPEWPREPIMPGEKAKIKAIYNAGSYRGVFSKGITVQSNSASGNVQLTIKGSVLDTPKEPKSPVKLDVGGGF
jgi:hypothetical protein